MYKAEDLKLERTVALKFLSSYRSGNEADQRRFLREARASSILDHPNICTVYEIDETDDGRLFIAMAFCEGETLKKKIERGPLPLAEAVSIAAQVADGLAAAHCQGGHSPGRQARQRHRHALGAGQARGLRHRQAGRPVAPDPRGHGRGHGRLHVARADPRRGDRRPDGRLGPGRGVLRDGLGGLPVRRRVGPRAHPPHPRPRARAPALPAGRRAARGRADRLAGAGQGPRRTLRQHGGDARGPRGRRRGPGLGPARRVARSHAARDALRPPPPARGPAASPPAA